MTAAVDITANPWAFNLHIEVWVLVAFLVGAWIYSVRVIGPRVVGPGGVVVTRRQKVYFVATILMLWAASDWPIHDIGETYLYGAHMLQHMMLSYFLPPLALLAMPEWLLRILIGNGKAYTALRFMTRPVVAGVLFNLVIMLTHIPGMVNASGDNAVLHYSLHFLLVSTSLLMWMPVIGPFKELHMGYPGKMVYLFAQSVVPTIPAAWLSFADHAVYKRYDIPVRVWGISVVNDQQTAGAIMKVGGTMFMWTIIIFMFFRRFGAGFEEQQSYRRVKPTAVAGAARTALMVEEALTYEQVTEAFERTVAAPEPERTT
ncbi:MAG: cytochrome c oxidase assembly protein [Ilumatobacteraceae bacterium]